MAATLYLPPVVFDGVLDISHYQPSVDFPAVKTAGIAAVFIKATEGVGYTDASWSAHTAAATAAGLLVGSYHFCTGAPPQEQADHFLGVVTPVVGSVVMLDFEHNPSGPTASADQVAQLGTIIEKVIGRPPLIYCGRWQIPVPHPVLSTWPLMLPEYGKTPYCPPGWSTWLFHQYTGSGHVGGIDGDVDRSVFAGTQAELIAWWKPASSAIPVPAIRPVPVLQGAA